MLRQISKSGFNCNKIEAFIKISLNSFSNCTQEKKRKYDQFYCGINNTYYS